MYFDPTGYVVKTMYEYQKDLLNPGRHNYGLKDITKLQMMGYGKDDKFILNDDGTFTHYNLYNQVVDTVGAVFCSVEVDAGVGYGLGASAKVSDVDITALAKADLISLSVSYSNGFDIGAYLYAGAAGISALGYAVTTPFNIASHVTNPYLTDMQKGIAIGEELLFAGIGIAGAALFVACPVAGLLFGFGLTLFSYCVMDIQISYWETDNKARWGGGYD